MPLLLPNKGRRLPSDPYIWPLLNEFLQLLAAVSLWDFIEVCSFNLSMGGNTPVFGFYQRDCYNVLKFELTTQKDKI